MYSAPSSHVTGSSLAPPPSNAGLAVSGERHPKTDATTFTFLGFLHVWGKSEGGKNVVRQSTAKDRYARAQRATHLWCRANRHRPLSDQHAALSRKMRGHFAYYGISGNSRRIRWYAHQVERI